MFIKLTLSMVIIVLSTLTGYLVSLNYDYRIRQLSNFVYSLKIMEAEMSYSKNYLMEILNKLSSSNEKVISEFYMTLVDALKSNEGKEFSALWCESAEEAFKNGSLTKSDIKLIKDFGKSLGKIDLKNQQKIFDYFYKRLELQLEEAINQKTQKSRVYKNLGVAVGVMVVVVLI